METDNQKLNELQEILVNALEKKGFKVKNEEISDGAYGMGQNSLTFKLYKIEETNPLILMVTVFTVSKELEN